MNHFVSTFLISILLLSALPILGFAQESADVVVGKYVKIHSKILNEERTILVHLPSGYDQSKERYPVLYELDGEMTSNFTHSAATIGVMVQAGIIPQMMLVAIVNTDRNRDMFPVTLEEIPNTGGADNFLRFITEELIPFVDQNYRTEPFSMLYGHSNSAVFAVYTLLTKSESFNAYIASSPMLGYCKDYIFDKTNEFLEDNTSPNKFFYVTYSDDDYERVTGVVPAFAETLNTKAPKDFKWKVTMLKGEGHVPYTSLYDALRFVFSDWKYPQALALKNGLDAVRRHYEQLSNEYGFTAKIPFGVLFDLGFDLFQNDNFEDAIEVFEFTIDLYPKLLYTHVPHYLLGIIYESRDEKDIAIEHYRKALELNPDFERAHDKLKNLEQKK